MLKSITCKNQSEPNINPRAVKYYELPKDNRKIDLSPRAFMDQYGFIDHEPCTWKRKLLMSKMFLVCEIFPELFTKNTVIRSVSFETCSEVKDFHEKLRLKKLCERLRNDFSDIQGGQERLTLGHLKNLILNVQTKISNVRKHMLQIDHLRSRFPVTVIGFSLRFKILNLKKVIAFEIVLDTTKDSLSYSDIEIVDLIGKVNHTLIKNYIMSAEDREDRYMSVIRYILANPGLVKIN